MKQTTRIAIAGLLSAAGSALQAIAAEMSGSTPAEQRDPEKKEECSSGSYEQQEGRSKRTRKQATAADPSPIATPELEKPEAPPTTDPAPEPAAEKKGEDDGESEEAKQERYLKNRAAIEPLVKGYRIQPDGSKITVKPQGPQVKAIIAKLSPTELLPDLPLSKQEDFESDLEALLM